MILGIIFFVSQPVPAQEARVFIVPLPDQVQAGRISRFALFIHNPGNKAVTTDAYNRITATIEKNNKQVVVEAGLCEQTPALVTIPANGYAKREYRFLLPQEMDGNISLSLPALNAGPVLLAARSMPFEDRTEQIGLDEKESIVHPLAKYMSPYEPMYFLLGVDPGLEKSKFQISFKYKLFDFPQTGNQWKPYLNGIHIAYTQTSFWDLGSDSAPFEDTSYKPELFYCIPKIDLGISWIKAFGFQTGYKHESNGKDGEDSRSTNFIYIEPIMAFSLGNSYFLKMAPRIWTYVNNNQETNKYLDRYRGYFNLQMAAGALDGFILETNTRWADKGPTFQADLSYPLNILKGRFSFYLHLQYFNGYAEKLIDYNEKNESIRLGFSIVR